ncbi:hypothetical protein ABBQ38_000314 [Trebouxia sp. C0009 RCD-2024]
MATVNIGQGNAGDQFYRYKMPKLQAKVEGRGNGIKTCVVNNVEIAKALERPPEYIIKYFGCELGAQTNYNKESGTSIVNGAHDNGKLLELLEGFIKKFVQCYACGNPETQVKIKKENITLKCKACGNVSNVDMRHKVTTFMLRNPPEEKMSKTDKKLKKMEQERLKEAAGDNLDKEEKKKKKKEKDKKKKKGDADAESGGDSPGSPGDDADATPEEVVWMTDTSEQAAQERAQKQLTKAMADMVTQGNLEAEQAEARKREKAERKQKQEEERKQAEEEAAAAKAEEERRAAAAAAEEAARQQAEAAEGDPAVAQMRRVLNKTKSGAKVADAMKQLEVEGGLAGKWRVLYEALFAEDTENKLSVQISKRKLILQAVGDDPPSQMAQLLALEYLVGVTDPDRLNQVSLALKALYDDEIVDEALIIAWYNKPLAGKVLGVPAPAAKAVRQAAAKLVEWLQEAESDEDSDESEDSLAEE